MNVDEILEQAEAAMALKSMADDRAACGGWPPPVTPGDYLMWILDEVEVQVQQGVDNPDEAAKRLDYAGFALIYAGQLYAAGVRPSPRPWDISKLEDILTIRMGIED